MMSPPILSIRRVFQRYEINFPAPIAVASETKGARRRHWPIENRLQWVLDVTFRDDQSRLGTGHGAKKMAIARYVALNPRAPSRSKNKQSIKPRRGCAGKVSAAPPTKLPMIPMLLGRTA